MLEKFCIMFGKEKSISRFSVVIFFVMMVSSCAKDEDLVTREDYAGSWKCNETPAGQASTTFTITISLYGSGDSLAVKNFNNLGSSTTTYFTINSTDVNIPTQTVSGFDIAGSGTLANSKMNLVYTVDGLAHTAICSR